jgi:glutamyl/glutaminyl-tRNA synthetase
MNFTEKLLNISRKNNSLQNFGFQVISQAPGFSRRCLLLLLILGTDWAKLSKRHGAVSMTEYRQQGYLPETMVNFLALLGWSLEDKTVLLSLQELIDDFSLERIEVALDRLGRLSEH